MSNSKPHNFIYVVCIFGLFSLLFFEIGVLWGVVTSCDGYMFLNNFVIECVPYEVVPYCYDGNIGGVRSAQPIDLVVQKLVNYTAPLD